MRNRRTRLAAAALALAISAGVPLAVTSAASAKSCKWVTISYDPATGTSVHVCTIGRP